MNTKKLLLILCVASFFGTKAQNHSVGKHNHDDSEIKKHLNNTQMVFASDSVNGFNEIAAWEQASASGAAYWEQLNQVNLAKRLYINTKYKLVKYNDNAAQSILQGPCANVDFELGNANGWTITEGLNTNSNTQAGCCPTASTRFAAATVGTDPTIPALQRVPAGGGNFSLRIGDGATTTGHAVRANQTFVVTAANSVFIYKFAVVLEDPSGNPHTCAEQAYFNIQLLDGSNNPIPCGQFNIINNGSGCSAGGDPSFVAVTGSNGLAYQWKNWTTRAFDLTSYIGQNVTVRFIASDCTLTGHAGWAYIDASCSPFTLNLNGTDIPVGQTNNSTCGATSNTLCAPPGFNYAWSGPGVSGQTGQCVVASATGSYSVTLGIPGSSCAFNPMLFSNFVTTPSPSVSATLTQPICLTPVGSATLSPSGGTGPYTYSWSPAVPSPTGTINNNLPLSTIYTATVTDANGCKGITTFSVNPFPPAPAYTLNVSPNYVISCTNPSITLTYAQTNTNTATSWSGPSGPITGTTSIATTAGTYTYVAINSISSCSLTGIINITGNTNIPSATFTVGCSTNTINLNATAASPTFSLNWINPSSPTYTISNPGNSTSIGVYTLVVTNPSNNCVQTYTTNTSVPPITIVTTPTTNVLTCNNATINAVTSSSTPGVVFTWFNGVTTTTATSLPITSAGSYTANVLIPNGCSSQSVITVGSNTIAGISITAPTTVICQSGTSTLTALDGSNGPYTYTWNPTGVQTNTFSASATNVYTVTATAANGCTATATQSITVIPLPTATFTVSCNVNTITLNATAVSTGSLVWGIPSSPTTTATNPATSTAVGIYTLAIVNQGCVNTYTTSTAVPTINLATTPSNTLTCLTQTINASVSSTPTTNVIYTWFNGVTTTTASTLPITSAGTYTAYAQIINGCSSRTVFTIGSNTLSTVSITSQSIIPCLSGSLALTSNGGVGGPYTYTWVPSTPVVTGNTYNVTNSGNYTVIATNSANGCTATATQIVIKETINASFIANPYQGMMPLTVSFNNTSNNTANTFYDWNLGNGNLATGNTPSTIYETQGTYTVILTATKGTCVDTAMRIIKVDTYSALVPPNVFTPNGDGKNDVFKLDATNMGDIYMIIFDRWGLKMFESTDNGKMSWDGKTIGGKLVTDGTYFYIINATGLDDKKYDLKGSISLFQ